MDPSGNTTITGMICPIGSNLINVTMGSFFQGGKTMQSGYCTTCPTGTTQLSSDFVCMTPIVSEELVAGISNNNLYIGLAIGGGVLLLLIIIIVATKSGGSNRNYQNYGYNYGYNQGYDYDQGYRRGRYDY